MIRDYVANQSKDNNKKWAGRDQPIKYAPKRHTAINIIIKCIRKLIKYIFTIKQKIVYKNHIRL